MDQSTNIRLHEKSIIIESEGCIGDTAFVFPSEDIAFTTYILTRHKLLTHLVLASRRENFLAKELAALNSKKPEGGGK